MAVRYTAAGQHHANASPQTGSLHTFVFWGRIQSGAGEQGFMGYSDNATVGAGADGSPAVIRTGAGVLAVDIANIGTSATGLTIVNGTWYCMALVRSSATAGTLYYGTDPAALSSIAVDFTSATTTPVSLTLGNWTYNSFLNGNLAGFKQFAAALTAAEISNELSQYQPNRTLNLIRSHPEIATETLDHSGNGNTLTGGAGSSSEDGPPIRWGRARGSRVKLSAAGAQNVTLTGIASEEAFGTPSLSLTVSTSGIGSEEAFGTPTVILSGAVAPSGIPSEEAFGSVTVTTGPVSVTANGIASEEAFGTLAVALTVSPAGIPSGDAFGTLSLTVGAVGIVPAGIASAEAFGSLTLTAGPIGVTTTGIPSAEAFGAPAVSFSLYVTGIPSGEAFGSASLGVGPISIFLTGIASAEAFGTPSLSVTLDVRLRVSTIRERVVPRYELLVMARIPQQTAAPAFLPVDPIEWSSLTWSSTVSRSQGLSATTKIASIPESIRQRFRDPRGLPTELWLQRNGKTVFAGPLLGGAKAGGDLTIVAGGLMTYLDWMIVKADMRFDQVDQFTIAKQLVDQWQADDFGNFGIVTANVGVSGKLRDGTYARNEIHYIGKRIQELGARADGFDIEIDPTTRALQLWHPTKGVDRSTGENAVVFDSRNVDAQDGMFSLGPGDLASEAFGVGSSTGGAAPLWSVQSNLDLRAAFGRTAITGSWSDVSEQANLDDHVAALLAARDQPLRAPGRRVRVTPDSDLDSYTEGDTVQYELDKLLGIGGAYRIRSRKVSVEESGQESVDLEFV